MKKTKNIVFIAKSIDGYIAGKKGELDWLNSIPNPEGEDMGFVAIMEEIDALVMGRNTFEMVCSFGGDWPYSKHVFVLSRSLSDIPDAFKDKASLLKGEPHQVLKEIHQKGYDVLYIDGGRTVQDFLKEDLIDELKISSIPILLGGGIPLFSELPKSIEWEHDKTEIFLGQIVQSHYRRKQQE